MLKKTAVVLGLFVGSILVAWGASNTLSGLSAGGPISITDLFYDVQTAGVGGVKVTGTQFLSFVFGNVNMQTASIAGNLTGSTANFTKLSFTGQLVSAGGTPTVSACGTAPAGAVSSTSTNQSGSLKTGGGTLTSCGIGFSAPLTSIPGACTIVAESSAAASDLTQTFVSSLTSGGWTLSAVNTVNSATFGYICM